MKIRARFNWRDMTIGVFWGCGLVCVSPLPMFRIDIELRWSWFPRRAAKDAVAPRVFIHRDLTKLVADYNSRRLYGDPKPEDFDVLGVAMQKPTEPIVQPVVYPKAKPSRCRLVLRMSRRLPPGKKPE